MIRTDAQRRWWFATHPEYGSQGSGGRNGPSAGRNGKSNKVRPKDVDAYVDSMLPYADASLAAFLRSVKRNFGTEAAATDPIQLAAGVRTPDDGPLRAMQMGGGGGGVGAGAQPFRVPIGGGGSSPKGPTPPEPGKWVDVNRGPAGLEHQSKMSGQPIQRTGGQLSTREYEVRGVRFDDYKNGNLIDYKGDYSKFIDKGGIFQKWFRGAQSLADQAWRQVEAAGGIPVIWRVPANQVDVFRKAIGDVPGLIIQGH